MPRRRGIGLDFLDALPSDGERRLMLAVLVDAVRLTRSLQAEEARAGQLSLLKRRQLLREYAWFQSAERDRPFAFQVICEALGLDADYVRRCVFRQPDALLPMPVRRYAARVEESWLRQRKHGGQIVLLKRRRRTSARRFTVASDPVANSDLKAAIG
ncbi:MAG: hypothetical protein N3C12_09535 [Candidatus Binatia bacterium]|nr:hypothetical protein [Candidatus Binatia bacterium]